MPPLCWVNEILVGTKSQSCHNISCRIYSCTSTEALSPSICPVVLGVKKNHMLYELNTNKFEIFTTQIIELLLSIVDNDFWMFEAFQSAYHVVFNFTVRLLCFRHFLLQVRDDRVLYDIILGESLELESWGKVCMYVCLFPKVAP